MALWDGSGKEQVEASLVRGCRVSGCFTWAGAESSVVKAGRAMRTESKVLANSLNAHSSKV